MKIIFKSLSLVTVLSSSLLAESEEPYQLSFVTVGPLSDVRWVPDKNGEGGNPEAINPNSIPPQSIYYKLENDRKQTVKLSLNKPSAYLPVSKNQVTLYKMKAVSGTLVSEKFHEITLPKAEGNYSIILTKRINSATWNIPKMLILTDDSEEFPAGSLRISNQSSKVITVKIAKDQQISLEPNTMKIYKEIFVAGEPVKFEASFLLKEKKRLLAKSSLRKDKQIRHNLVFVETANKKRPVTAHFFNSTKLPNPGPR